MNASIHDNLPFWSLWLVTLGVCARKLVRSLRSPVSILGFVPVACTMFAYIYVIQSAAIVYTLGNRIRPEYYAMGQAIAVLSLLGLLAGWYKGLGRVAPPPPARPDAARNQTLWYAGVATILVGIASQYYFFFVVAGDYATSAYLYLLFHIAYPGLAICIYLASSDPTYRANNNVLLLMTLGFLQVAPWVYGVRRSPVFTFIIVAIYAFYLARPRKVNRGIVLGGLALACVTMLFFFTIRNYVTSEGSWSARQLQSVNASNVLLKKAFDEDDNEFLYSCCIIATCNELERYQWGTSYLSLASHWIPRQLWPDKPAIAQGWLDPVTGSDVEEVTTVRPTPGAAYSGIGEAFQEFSWFVPVFWAALGWAFGRLYRYAITRPQSVMPVLYVGLISASHYLIMQGFANLFVPAMIYLVTPVLIYAVTGSLTGAAPVRRAVAARLPVGQFGRT